MKLSLLGNITKGFVVAIATLSVVVPFAHAQEVKATAQQQEMRYDVYAGGIHAVEANIKTNISADNNYDMSVYAKTHGMLGKLAPWKGTFSAKGWTPGQNAQFQPSEHKSESMWRKELEVKTYHYNPDGTFNKYTLADKDNKRASEKVDSALTKGTTDVISATLAMMDAVAKGQKCEGASDVFDGKRRFKLIFNHKQTVQLKKSKYNLYEGPATECSVEVKPVAGKWHDKPRGWISIQEQGRESGKMPTVWFAKVDENQVAVPVKVRVKTDYGTLFMHLTEYQSSAKKLKLK